MYYLNTLSTHYFSQIGFYGQIQKEGEASVTLNLQPLQHTLGIPLLHNDICLINYLFTQILILVQFRVCGI